MIANMTAAGFAHSRIRFATRIAAVGALLATVGALVWIGFFRHGPQEEAGTMLAAQQTALAHYVARDIEFKLAERTSLLTHMASDLPIALLEQPTQLRRWLAVRQHQQPLFTQGIFVTDTNGRTLADYPQRLERAQIQYDDRDYLQHALTEGVAIGRPAISHITKEPVLPMAAPVLDANGTVKAVLIGITALHAPGFLTLNPQTPGDEDTDFLLVSPHDHILVASTQAAQVLQPTPAAGVDAVLDRAMDGYRGSDVRTSATGVEEVSAIATVPSTDWFVLARHANTSASRAGYTTYVPRAAAIGSLALLAIAGLLLLQRWGSLTTPLGLLHKSFAQLRDTVRHDAEADPFAAYHDPVTGLPNAALLADRLNQALARAQRNGARVGLLHINLDRFTTLNTHLGFEAGNAALTEIGRRLLAIVRETDTLARVGGDTFVVLLGELDSGYEPAKIAACAVAAKCLDAVAPTLMLGTVPYQLGASVGIALSDGPIDLEALQSAATRAMYHAKQVGGDRYFVAATSTAMPANPATASA